MDTSSEEETFLQSSPPKQVEKVLLKRKIPLRYRFRYRIEDYIDEINWLHVAFKICAFSYFFFLSFLAWQVLPLPGHWSLTDQFDKVPITYQNFAK